jgi:hypothetical protein
MNSSPNQRLMSRRTKTADILQPIERYKPEIVTNVKEDMMHRRQEAKESYDKKTKRLPDLEIGQPVFLKLRRNDKKRMNGKVERIFKDRSYGVMANGNKEVYRRNRQQLISFGSSNERPKEESDVYNDSLGNVTSDRIDEQTIRTRPQTNHQPKSPKSVSPATPSSIAMSTTDCTFQDATSSTPVTNDERFTRHGRVIRRPVRFQDYTP